MLRTARLQYLASTCTPCEQPREKGLSVSAKVMKAYEEEFLFNARKLFFLDMHWFHFLSEASWETITFAFIYF